MSIRIGILSFVHLHAEGYQTNLKRMDGVDLVGFFHGDPDERRYFAAKHGLRWFPEHHELLAEGLDGVLICSENANHLELIEKAAAGRKLEKRRAVEIVKGIQDLGTDLVFIGLAMTPRAILTYFALRDEK